MIVRSGPPAVVADLIVECDLATFLRARHGHGDPIGRGTAWTRELPWCADPVQSRIPSPQLQARNARAPPRAGLIAAISGSGHEPSFTVTAAFLADASMSVTEPQTLAMDGGCRIKSSTKTWAARTVTAVQHAESVEVEQGALLPSDDLRVFRAHP